MNYKLDKDFEDQSWQQMHVLLNREMPEEKRKRRFVFWWWLGGGVLLTSLLGYGVYHFNKNNIDKQSQKPIAELRAQQSNLPNNITAPPSIQAEQNNLSNKENTPPQLESAKTAQLSKGLKSLEGFKTENIVSTNKNGRITAQPSKGFKPLEGLEKQNTGSNTEPPQLESEKTPESITSNAHNFETFDELDKRELALLNFENLLNLNIKKPIISEKKSIKRKLLWGINAGTHSQKLSNFDGFHAGLIAAYPLSRKFNLSAGLSYRQTKVYGDSLNYTSLQANGISTPTSSGFNIVEGKQLILSKLQYIEMPIALNFNINKKWSTFGGLKVSYLINQKVNYRGDSSTVYVIVSSNKSANADQVFVGNPTIKTLFLNQWSTAILGGVRYHFTPKLSAALRYDYDLKNISKSQNRQFYNRYLGIDITYLFK